ncbi:hypothetical protein NQZ79_g1037 [Umbelopsis isabellina]|nr:hypothetical protein NQZ79_g1037 [Umbelopsis isabellina]
MTLIFTRNTFFFLNRYGAKTALTGFMELVLIQKDENQIVNSNQVDNVHPSVSITATGKKRALRSNFKGATKRKAVSRTYNANEPTLSTASSATTPPVKRERALPKTYKASPHNQRTYAVESSSAPKQTVKAKAKVMVVAEISPPRLDLQLTSPFGADNTPERYHLPSASAARLEFDDPDSRTSSIGLLDDDCLALICSVCSDLSIYSILRFMGVCKRWRSIALSPVMWRNVTFTWRGFCRDIKGMVVVPQIVEQLALTKGIRFWDQYSPMPEYLPMSIKAIAWAFPQLREVEFNGVYLDHIDSFISAFRHLEVVSCRQTLKSVFFELSFAMFSRLSCLRELFLQFAQPTEHSSYRYMMNKKGLWLPTSLESLTIINIFDPEENDITGRDWLDVRTDNDFDKLIARWNVMEETLLFKYQSFSQLHNLQKLTIGRCNSWTAKVWLDCFLPCFKTLEHLHLISWEGDGYRESPISWRRRHTADADIMNTSDDVETAMKECISHMKSLLSLRLESFNVPDDVVDVIYGLPNIKSVNITKHDVS